MNMNTITNKKWVTTENTSDPSALGTRRHSRDHSTAINSTAFSYGIQNNVPFDLMETSRTTEDIVKQLTSR